MSFVGSNATVSVPVPPLMTRLSTVPLTVTEFVFPDEALPKFTVDVPPSPEVRRLTIVDVKPPVFVAVRLTRPDVVAV